MHPLSTHKVERVRKAALEQLEHTAAYNIAVFFGTKESPGIGAFPQQQILNFVEQLEIEEIETCWAGTLVLIEKLLSEEVRGTEWSYNQVVISHIAIPVSDQVADVRQRAIDWVIRSYPQLDAVRHRARLLGVLNGAIRNPRGESQASVAMIAKDALVILQFFESLIATELPQLVEKIEHHAYWIFFHSLAEEVRTAALEVKAAADVYIDFLERLAAQRGGFALQLILEHTADVDRFLVPLLRGLAAGGSRKVAGKLIDGWLHESRNLLQIAYALDDSAIFSPELLARVLDKAIKAKNIRAIVACMSSAVSNFSTNQYREPIRLFASAITSLTELKSSAWIFELWFRPKIKEFLGAFDEMMVDSVLANLMTLEEIDYHAEELLYLLAQTHAVRVLNFLLRQ